ncbi:chemotaxis protein CheW [Rhodocyclus tenuis]|uniref:Chemotaxis protein CheW n=2 Tax=Rhodocyclus TaxID=1064 RepID=A0A6L5JY49_RHOTE|nr:chemotaxis protein CheW [Rhodocyclus gracilis]MQY51762.1 chemotaxis protein CheW [Rhodocyclus gracilis]MRD73242.1 chemotaxis protein CheW [Rhodocyclus gracilis]NJA88977.1 chemotaxis protein CheW [Rhodocyclus gracilis]
MGQLVQRQSGAADAALAATAAPQQYLTFSLAGEMFAVAILNVKEIIEFGNLTEIPMTPPFIRGVINLRGAVVPVIDLASRFGGKPASVARRTCIVIVELEEDDVKHDIGVMVDAVSEVLEVARSDIEPPPAFGARIRADFISGMGKINGKFVIILNVAKALSASEIAQLTKLGDPDNASEASA